MKASLPPAAIEGPAASRVLALFLLVVVYTFNFLDRQIIGILAVPIKAELGLSDSQLGLMAGLAFVRWPGRRWLPPPSDGAGAMPRAGSKS